MKRKIKEDVAGGVTQVSNVAPGEQIDVFGEQQPFNISDWYEELLNLQDYQDDDN